MEPLSQKIHLFQEHARAALEGEPTTEALERIIHAYSADMAAAQARVNGHHADALRAMAQRQTADDMLASLHKVAAAEILRNARLEAYTTQLRAIVDRIRAQATQARKDAEEADGDITPAVPVVDLEAILARPLDRPEFTPTVVAFVPSTDHKFGQFSTDDGAIRMSYPFTGWSIVVRQNAPESRRLEPTFLCDDRALPQSFVHDVYGMSLTRLH